MNNPPQLGPTDNLRVRIVGNGKILAATNCFNFQFLRKKRTLKPRPKTLSWFEEKLGGCALDGYLFRFFALLLVAYCCNLSEEPSSLELIQEIWRSHTQFLSHLEPFATSSSLQLIKDDFFHISEEPRSSFSSKDPLRMIINSCRGLCKYWIKWRHR